MRLSACIARYHSLPAALAARCGAIRVQCSRTPTAALQQSSRRLASSRSNPSRSLTPSVTRSCLHRPIQQHSTARLGPTAAMATPADLPADMLADLQLLQQAYEQLPFAAHNPVSHIAAVDGSSAQLPAATSAAAEAAAATGEQLVMSAPAGRQQKRCKTSSTPAQQATDISSTQEPPVGLHHPAVSPEQRETDTQLPAAAAADGGPAIDASLQLATPPPKPPRARRGRKPALQANPAATVTPVSAPSSPAAAAAAVVAPAAPVTEATAPAKRSRRQSAEATLAASAKQARPRKRKEAAAQQESLVEQQLAASLPAADTAAVDAVLAAAAAEDLDTVGAARGRGRGRRSSTTNSRSRGRGRRSTDAAAAAGDAADAPALTLDGSDSAAAAAAAAAANVEPAAQAKPAARRRRSSSKETAAEDSNSDHADPTAAAAAAADKPVKPVRRTKKVIAAEVLEAASQGHFNELTSLASTYSHVALFNNSSNAAAWEQLMQQAQQQPQPQPATAADAAASAPQQQQSQQQSQQQQQPGQEGGAVGRASSLSLCRSSGLGSFRQQVWLHSQSQSVFDAEAVATATQQQDDNTPASLLPASQPPAATPAADDGTAAGTGTATNGSTGSTDAPELQAAAVPAPQPLTREVQQAQLKVLANVGYACLCQTMRQYEIFNSRDCVKKTRDAPDGLHKVSELALQNARDLVPLLHWNEAHGIRLFRLSSNIFPWMTSYAFEDLPHWADIQKALRAAGDLAKRLGHRLTFHPSEYCKIAGERPEWVTQSVAELEVHSRIFDEMGFLPAIPYNKINIHVGGTYGDKEAALERFSKVVNERLSPNCKARLTVENDDRASLYHVLDLMKVHRATGIPIVFDFHHWRFCTGDQTQEEAFRTALTTWPAGVRPVVHWSESPEDPNKMLKAHSEYIDGPINLFGLEGQVDVMIESKGKELALLEYRQWVVNGDSSVPGPRTVRAAAFAAAAAEAEAAAAAAEEEGEEDEEEASGRGKRKKKQPQQQKKKQPAAGRRAVKKKVVSESESESEEAEEETTTTDED